MLGKMKKLKSLVIVTSCVLLTGAIFPGRLLAETAIEEWVARYNVQGNFYDEAIAIALDPEGNVYVTGRSRGGGTSFDYATVKYDPNGNELWVVRYNGPGNDYDSAFAMALDPEGNVYVTGYSYGSGTSGDYATVKYDSSGNELWVARYNGPGNDYDSATAMALDSEDNVYVTGRSKGGGTLYDYATVKYDPNGNELWAARYDGPENSHENSHDEPFAIAVDSEGNVYVTGRSRGGGTSYDYATVKYDSSGNELWVARFDGPGNGADSAKAMALDSEGNIYVTGYSYGSGTYAGYTTVKYDSSGNELWVARYNGPANGLDSAFAMALDPEGNVYVTGRSLGSYTGTYFDYATVKYDPNGNELWVVRYNGPGNGADSAKAMALDSEGNIYVTGWSYGSGYATVKYVQHADAVELVLDLAQEVIDRNR